MNSSIKRKDLSRSPPLLGFFAKLERKWRNVFLRWWACEIVAALVSFSATIALIVVLKGADQQQQKPWQIGSTQITLNTVIVIPSTVLRTSLLVMVSGALDQSSWNWFAEK